MCFIDGYGKIFDNCVSIKEFYKNVSGYNSKQKVLTKDGKMKNFQLILEPTKPDLENYKKSTSY